MKANELRIGNYFTDEDKEPFTLKRIEFEDDEADCTLVYGNAVKGDYVWIEDAKPIPLTEEWLVKLGFEKHHLYSDQYNKGNYSVVFYKDNRVVFWISDCDGCPSSVDTPFVHSLQNLVHALTGEELTTL